MSLLRSLPPAVAELSLVGPLMRARTLRLRLHTTALCMEALGTLFIFLDSVRLSARFPSKPGVLGTLGDPLGYRVWYYHASALGFALLFLGILTASTALWLEHASLPIESAHGPHPNDAGDTPRKLKPTGFERIGIVVSCLWLLLFPAVYFLGLSLYPSWLTRLMSNLYKWSPGRPAIRGEAGYELGFIPEFPYCNTAALVTICLLPVVFGWLFLWLLPSSFRWIRDGFRQTTRKA